MNVSRTERRLRAVLAVAGPLALATCQGGGEGPSRICEGYDPSTGQRGPDFAGAAGAKLNAIMDTSVALVKAAREIESDTLGACKDMARALGIPEAELAPATTDPGAEVRAACTRVKSEIDKIVAALDPQVRITIVATPAVCTVSAEVEQHLRPDL